MLLNEKLHSKVEDFSGENCYNGNLANVAKFRTNPYNFVACLPNPCKLSILIRQVLGDIFAIFLLQILLFLVNTLKFS